MTVIEQPVVEQPKRNISALKQFFQKDSVREPVSNVEMKDFWQACSEQEKSEFCTQAEHALLEGSNETKYSLAEVT